MGVSWTLRCRTGFVCALVVTTACAPRASAPVAPGPASPATAAAPGDPAWLADLETELTALRGLPFKWRVPFGTESKAAFRAKVRQDLWRDLPSPKSADVSRSYVALGFAERGFDLSHAMEEALATQVAAYYDPERRAFRVIGTDVAVDDPKRAMVVSHELVHALQDQYFDLQRFSGDRAGSGLDEDQKLARRFVIEGEATFLMMAHGLGNGPPSERRLGSWAVAGLRMETRMLSAMDMLDLAASLRQGSSAEKLDPEARSELEALAKLPVVVTLPLFEPYFKGAELISEVWAAGGWPAVDALFRDPPDSTEQALHPAEKLLGHRDPPVRMHLAPNVPGPVSAARSLGSEVVGELGWRVYFKTWRLPDPETAASGWGGDRYWSWAVGERTLTVTATTWDAQADAERFFAAYEATLANRFPRGTATGWGASGLRLEGADGTLVALVRRGSDVDIVTGARPSELDAADKILKSVKRTQQTESPQ